MKTIKGFVYAAWVGVRTGVAAFEMLRQDLGAREVLRAEFIGGLTLVNREGFVTLTASVPGERGSVPVEKTGPDCVGVRWLLSEETAEPVPAEALRAFGLGVTIDQLRAFDEAVQAQINLARAAMGERFKKAH